MRPTWILVGVAVLGMVVALMPQRAFADCGSCGKDKGEPEKPGTVNAKCPIMGGKVNPKVEARTLEGKKVGFCCPKCPPKWDKLSEKQKRAKLAEVTPRKK